MNPVHPHRSGGPPQHAVVAYPGADELVASESRGSGLVGCLLFALIPLGVVAGVVGYIAAILMTDYEGEYVGGGLVALVLLLAVPWGLFMVRKARQVRTILGRMVCPQCQRGTKLTVDGRTNRYQLVCDGCRVCWQTSIGAPRSGAR